MQVIGIDLGSNTLSIIKYDCSSANAVATYEKIVRTAQNLAKSGVISKEAIEAIINALLEAKKKLDFNNCKIKAVATEALRVAKNSQEVVQEIKEKTGISFEIISPKTEALLTLNAVKKRLELLGINNDFILIDIGGGSTEISFFIKGEIITKSFKLGIVTVANIAKDLNDIKDLIDKKSKDIKEFVKDFDIKNLEFVATAGTPTTIAAMKLGLTYETYNPNLVNGVILEFSDLDFYLEKLLNMSKKDREIAVGVGRDDLIVAGVLILRKIYEILNKDKAIIVDDGLKEGVALLLCKSS